MFADYERLVLEHYQSKKSRNMLPSGLTYTTQARLKKECVMLCRGNIHGKDEKVIRDFCEEWDNTKTCLQNIDKYDVDKFKALSNFMKGNTESTDPKNIQLLAWLIDFPDRPFDYTKNYSSPMEIQAGVDEPESEGSILVEAPFSSKDRPAIGSEDEIIVADKTPYDGNLNNSSNSTQDILSHIQMAIKKMLSRKFVVVGVLLAIVMAGGYWWWDRGRSTGGCMYWAGDHYQPILCSQTIPNTLIVALDITKVKNFKKIMIPDTITHRAKGGVWYSKINNKVEFFTAAGEHPEAFGRYLKPITDHIIDTYIHSQTTSNQ